MTGAIARCKLGETGSEDEARFVYAESAPSFGRRLRQFPQDHELRKRWHATRQPDCSTAGSQHVGRLR